MGQWFSGRNQDVEQVERGANPYRYPPPTGTYFASRFRMGGEWFDTAQPEGYLFGDNNDLNFLGRRPTRFPYPVPPVGEPTRTMQSLINIRKDTVKLVKVQGNENDYNLEFVFDADVKCLITFYYLATEDVTADGYLQYSPKSLQMKSKSFPYKRGSGQVFKEPSCLLKPKSFPENELSFDQERPDLYPLVIHIEADDTENKGHSHALIGSFDKASDGTYIVKSIKQKQMIDGCLFVLQEIYGLENKGQKAAKSYKTNKDEEDVDDDDEDDDDDVTSQTGAECLICMEEPKDTFFLPCRHLCVCHECAESLRYRANNCPICRQPFKALLQLKAVQTASATVSEDAENAGSRQMKYNPVPLVEALNNCSTSAMIQSPEHRELSQSDVGTGIDDGQIQEEGSLSTTAIELTPAGSMQPLLEVSLPGTPTHSDETSSSPSIASTNRLEVDITEMPSVVEEDESVVNV